MGHYTNKEIEKRFWNAFWTGFICGAALIVFLIGLHKSEII